MKKGKRYLALTLALLLPAVWAAGCGSGNPSESGGGVETRRTVGEIAAGEMPADFRFSLTWGCYGVSSYDSATGRLVKTSDATRPEEYTATYFLDREELEAVWREICRIGVFRYPDNYDPHKGQMASSPSMTLILTVQAAGGEKTIACREISLGYRAKNPSGQRFLSGCQAIVQRLESSAAWQALPEYEFLYD